MSGSDPETGPDAPMQQRPPLDEKLVRQRQRSRALVTGLVLGALAILFYAIAIAKMTGAGG